MKLKLEAQDTISILNATEEVGAEQVAVLRAGFNKLLQSGKNRILLDLTRVNPASLQSPNLPKLAEALMTLAAWARKSDLHLLVCSPVEGIGHVATREEAFEILKSPHASLLCLEAELKIHRIQLTKQKAEFDQKLATPVSEAQDPLRLRKENSDLKKQISQLQRTVFHFFKTRTEPVDAATANAKRGLLDQSVQQVLELQKILKATT